MSPAVLLLALFAAGCASPSSPPPPPAAIAAEQEEPPEESAPLADRAPPAAPASGGQTFLMFSLVGSAPRFHGDLSLDGFGGETDGAPWGAGLGLSGEVRPPGWFAAVDFGWALFSDDLGLEESHPDFAGANVTHLYRFVELLAGPCVVELPFEEAPRGDAPPGRRVPGPSRLRVEPFLGVRGNQHTIDSTYGIYAPGNDVDEIWVDPIGGLRVEARPYRSLAFRARGDAGGLGGGSHREWRATVSTSLLLSKEVWLTAGWSFLAIDYERGNDEFRFHSRLDGPFLSLDFWF